FATDATEVAPDDIKTYFRRLNKSGVEPTAEEMKYSLLKASVPELKKLDELSNGLTSPARLANIVLRYCVSKNDEWKWKNDISLEEVIKLTEKDYNEIKDLVNNRLKNLIITIEKRTDLLLSYHRVRLSNAEKGDIFMLLLKLLENGESSINLSGLSMYLLWFSNKGKIQKAVETIWEASDINIKKGIWNAIDKSFTSLPLELSFFNKLNDMIDCLSENYDDRNQTFNLCKDIYQYIETYENKALFEKIINGFSKSEEGRDIVLFGCKKYMDDVFGGYDLSSPEWKEQNRPWDYDHIFPQSRMGKNIDDKDEYLYLLCNKMLQSFGNSCPLPFSENRGKNASLPEEDYPGGGYSDKVLVDTDDIRSYKNCGGEKLDATSAQNYALSICFLKGTSNRLAKLYSAWYNNCEIDELLSVSFNIIKAERRVLFLLEMLKNITEKFHHYIDIIQCTYTKYDGRQYKLDPQNPIDWAKGDGCWQSCGIEGTIKDSNEKCFLAVTTNGKDVEIGIRRHPELTQIQGT
ncbi:MAG: hypothetical protein HUJ74_01580, partial [Lachnospiraceae bacterium]|nr:hypothetical protein [Lachnospiraceae bacterium]